MIRNVLVQRLTALVMLVVTLVTGLFVPGLATAQTFNALWLTRSVSDTVQVVFPSEQWTPMVRVKKAKVDQLYSYEYRSGERWLTLNREDAATIPGLSAAQLSSVMRLPRRDATMVFARYVPQQSELVINAVKIEEGRDGYMTAYQTYFSPYHGERWAYSRAFLTDAEMADVSRSGRNPFASFMSGDRNNPKFLNIGWDGAMVAVGLAMRYFRTPYSVMSVQNLRMTQSVTSSGSFLHKKTTIKVDGYADPTWFIGLPTTMQTWGTTAAICVVPTGTTLDPNSGKNVAGNCPDNKLIAFAGVSFDQWTGGTMPSEPEHIYHWQQTKSGFTVLFFTLLVMAAAFVVGPELYAAVATEGTAAGAFVTPAAITGEAAAGYAGAAYAGGTLLTTSGPASLTTAKSGVFGSVGDGTRVATGADSLQVKDATAILVNRQINANFDSQAVCSDSGSLCSTQSAISAATPDPGKVIFKGDQQTLREREKLCKGMGLRFQALRDCIVQSAPAVVIP